jgi:hypothetical protein
MAARHEFADPAALWRFGLGLQCCFTVSDIHDCAPYVCTSSGWDSTPK